MNIRDLKYIVALANEAHFAKAAEKSFVSQPALSMQIKKLEDELGVTIFERSRKNFLITKIGQEIIERAKIILREVDELKNLAKNSQDPFSGEIRIGGFPTLASYFFPQFIKKITKNFPQLRIFLIEEKSENLIKKLQNGEIDAAFLAMPVSNKLFESCKIFEEPFFLAVNKNHPLAKKKQIAKKDLSKESLMLLEDGHCLRNQALEVCSEIGAFEQEAFRATSLETLRQMIVANMGITLIPQIAIDKKYGQISYIEILNAPKRVIGLYWRSSSTKKPLMTAIKEILTNILPRPNKIAPRFDIS